jgi:tetratricopeptide (TPR) repeat protein
MQNLAANDSLVEGRQALRQGDFAGAALAFSRGAAMDPDNPLHQHGAAVAARRLGDFESAELHYRAAIAATAQSPDYNGPNLTVIATRLVELYRTQGRYRDAEKLCFRILESPRTSLSRVARSRLHVCLADLYRRQGRLAAAERAYRVAIANRREVFGSRHPKTVQILPRLADVCRLLGRHEEADDLSRKAGDWDYPGTVGHA